MAPEDQPCGCRHSSVSQLIPDQLLAQISFATRRETRRSAIEVLNASCMIHLSPWHDGNRPMRHRAQNGGGDQRTLAPPALRAPSSSQAG